MNPSADVNFFLKSIFLKCQDVNKDRVGGVGGSDNVDKDFLYVLDLFKGSFGLVTAYLVVMMSVCLCV